MFKKKRDGKNIQVTAVSDITVFGTVGFKAGSTILMDGEQYEIVEVKSGTEMTIRPLPVQSKWGKFVSWVKGKF